MHYFLLPEHCGGHDSTYVMVAALTYVHLHLELQHLVFPEAPYKCSNLIFSM